MGHSWSVSGCEDIIGGVTKGTEVLDEEESHRKGDPRPTAELLAVDQAISLVVGGTPEHEGYTRTKRSLLALLKQMIILPDNIDERNGEGRHTCDDGMHGFPSLFDDGPNRITPGESTKLRADGHRASKPPVVCLATLPVDERGRAEEEMLDSWKA
jgi:hypothetical protein